MIVKIQWENGKPCSGTRVLVWIEGQGNKEVYSDQNGEAYFDYGPGSGTIYCDGQEVVRERSLSRRELITCESSGLFSYSYYWWSLVIMPNYVNACPNHDDDKQGTI